MIPTRRYPWIAQQNWHDILFIHTPVEPEAVRPFMPKPFTLDTYEGSAWISIVLFRATASRPRFMPEWLSYPLFHQMNMRTYVRFGDERGVYFFSVNTDKLLVKLGGNIVSMPFAKASMRIQEDDGSFQFAGKRLPTGKKGSFRAIYQPVSPVFTPDDGSLEHFLTERYCIWMIRGNSLVKAPINHAPWNLRHADITIQDNRQLPFPFTANTIAHYAAIQHAVIHPLEKVGMISS